MRIVLERFGLVDSRMLTQLHLEAHNNLEAESSKFPERERPDLN